MLKLKHDHDHLPRRKAVMLRLLRVLLLLLSPQLRPPSSGRRRNNLSRTPLCGHVPEKNCPILSSMLLIQARYASCCGRAREHMSFHRLDWVRIHYSRSGLAWSESTGADGGLVNSTKTQSKVAKHVGPRT